MEGCPWFRLWPVKRRSDGFLDSRGRPPPPRAYSVRGRRARRAEALAQRRAVAAAIEAMAGVLADLGDRSPAVAASMAGVLADLDDRSPDGPWKILPLPQSVRETAEWCGWLTFTAAWLDSALLSPPPRLRPLRRRWVHGLRARVPGILEALCASRGGREAFLTEWVEFSLASDVLRS